MLGSESYLSSLHMDKVATASEGVNHSISGRNIYHICIHMVVGCGSMLNLNNHVQT